MTTLLVLSGFLLAVTAGVVQRKHGPYAAAPYAWLGLALVLFGLYLTTRP